MASGRFKFRFNSTLILKKTQQNMMQNNQAMSVILGLGKGVQTRVTVMHTVSEVWLKNQESAVCHHRAGPMKACSASCVAKAKVATNGCPVLCEVSRSMRDLWPAARKA